MNKEININEKPKEITKEEFISTFKTVDVLSWKKTKTQNYFYLADFITDSYVYKYYENKITKKFYKKIVNLDDETADIV